MASENRVARTATEGVVILWEEKFFRAAKKTPEIVEALAQRENHFPTNALSMALERAKFLTRKGKKGAYEYIQQYPYVPDAEPPADEKGRKK
jgi:hypothetical protein